MLPIELIIRDDSMGRVMKPPRRKKDGRITAQTKDDFLFWVKKQNALKKRRLEQVMYAQALAVWADDGGAMQSVPPHSAKPDRKK